MKKIFLDIFPNDYSDFRRQPLKEQNFQHCIAAGLQQSNRVFLTKKTTIHASQLTILINRIDDWKKSGQLPLHRSNRPFRDHNDQRGDILKLHKNSHYNAQQTSASVGEYTSKTRKFQP